MFVRKRTELGLSPPNMQESAMYEHVAAVHDWKAGRESKHCHIKEVCGPSKITKTCLPRAQRRTLTQNSKSLFSFRT